MPIVLEGAQVLSPFPQRSLGRWAGSDLWMQGFFCETAPKQPPWDGHLKIGSGNCPRQLQTWSHPRPGRHECIFGFCVGPQWIQIRGQNTGFGWVCTLPGFAIAVHLSCAITPCRGAVSATSPACSQCVGDSLPLQRQAGLFLSGGDQRPWKKKCSAVYKMHRKIAQVKSSRNLDGKGLVNEINYCTLPVFLHVRVMSV